MDRIRSHKVVLERCDIQPSDDHVVFVAGDIDAKTGLSVPTECHYMPLATWMGMDTPNIVTITVESGKHLPIEEDQ